MGPPRVPQLALALLSVAVVVGGASDPQREAEDADAEAAALAVSGETTPHCTCSKPASAAPRYRSHRQGTSNGTHAFSPARTLHMPPSPALAAAALRTWGDKPALLKINGVSYPWVRHRLWR